MSDIVKSYNQEILNNNELVARGPRVFRYIGTIGKISIRSCYRQGGLIIRYGAKFICVKDLYITLDEVTVTGRIRRKRVKIDYYNRYLLARQGRFYGTRPRYRYNYHQGGGSYVGSNTSPKKISKVINRLTGKAKCVYGRIQNNSILKKTLNRFFGERTPIHLIINDKSGLKNKKGVIINGNTNYGKSYYITITLNKEQSVNRPSLAVARTILHEAIHAEIYRKIKSTNSDYNKIKIHKLSWPTLFKYYKKKSKNAQHNYMADYYRKAIELGLREYAKQIGETHSDQFYRDMAWNGLLDTESWNKQYKDPNYAKKEKRRIKKVISDYEKSGKNRCK